MPGKHEGILEQGHWQEIKPETWKPAAAPRATKTWGEFFKPAILTRNTGSGTLRPTAYLDGLRGFAAILVYIQHHILWVRDGNIAENGFGYNGNYALITVPILRILFTGGHFAVPTFFVISGYVLAAKPLQHIHNGDLAKLAENVGSALFRRWLRLYIPIIGTTYIFMSMWHVFGIWSSSPHPSERQSNFRDEQWKWYTEFKNITFIFSMGGPLWFLYNPHTWSIPYEMKGSIAVYTACMAFAKATKNARLLCEVGLMVYFMYIVDGWYCSMFIAGMFICDMDMLAKKDDMPRFMYLLEPYKEMILYNMLFVAMWLGGIPACSTDINVLRAQPMWYYLSYLKPQAVFDVKWFFLFWAASFMVICSHRIDWLRGFWELRVNQYLGKISYSLYLVHGPVIWILGDRIYSAVGFTKDIHLEGFPGWMNAFPLPMVGPFGLEIAQVVPQIILLPVTLYLAEMTQKIIDDGAVRFSTWLYKLTLPTDDTPQIKSANGHFKEKPVNGFYPS